MMNDRRGPLVALAVVFLFATPLLADFATIARTIQARTHAHRITIPLFGLARFAVNCIHPEGVHDVQLATFEGGSFDGVAPFDRSQLERGFQPLVEVHSARNGEWSLIFARPEPGGLVTLLVFAHDRHDTTLVQVVMDADRVAREVSRPRTMASAKRSARRSVIGDR
jgi:hypothetical protein